ncbi:MAG: HAD-IA family hydrolase [Acidobacteriota bacterium]
MPGRSEPRARRRDAGDRPGLKKGDSLSPIRAVLFDAGATLLYPDPPAEEVYARELAADGARFSPARLREALAGAWREVHERAVGDRYGGEQGEPEFWHAFLDRVRGSLDGGVVSAQAFERLARHFRDPRSWGVFPDVVPTLDRLEEAGLRLAVVSNWDSNLPSLLSGLELASRFQAVLVSAIERTGKPEREIFHRACARLEVEPGQALHVGDSRREDYQGAREAGLQALLLDRTGSFDGDADQIRSLTELAARLGL